jgi:hypothetical protein
VSAKAKAHSRHEWALAGVRPWRLALAASSEFQPVARRDAFFFETAPVSDFFDFRLPTTLYLVFFGCQPFVMFGSFQKERLRDSYVRWLFS